MSEIDESRKLTRRELRLLGMATGSIPIEEAPREEGADRVASSEAQPDPTQQLSAAMASIEIPLYDENGRLHNRREMRELRAQAEAEIAASLGIIPDPVDDAGLTEGAVRAEAVEETVTEVIAAPAPFDHELAATEAIDMAALFEEQQEPEPPLHEIGEAAQQPAAEFEEVEVEVIEADALAVDDTSGFEVAEAVLIEEEAEGETEASEPAPAYSFPDIAPLDEVLSVFDDPALRMMSSGAKPIEVDGDFDDLIQRAVVQEGASGSNNTSALILPTMPEADSLSGPIGETGEILLTGSISLPRSLGETGSHTAMHDAVESDPLDDLGLDDPTVTTGHMAPISAVKAVSVKSGTGAMVSDASKDKSKLPVVLISVGGVLVLVAGGLVVWAAVSGLFG